MFKVRVEAAFAAAHFLSRYNGTCERLHGHNYRVRLWVKGHALNEGGMLADFALLKKILREVIDPLDHSNLNDFPVFDNDPSAERIARHICEAAAERFPGEGLLASLIAGVDVYESPGSLARYIPD